jgi:membrane fusion protein (multidrug efflux system)
MLNHRRRVATHTGTCGGNTPAAQLISPVPIREHDVISLLPTPLPLRPLIAGAACIFSILSTGAQAAPTVPVDVTPVVEREINRVVQVTGTVTSARDARLSVATRGLVTGLYVDAGSRVAKGDPLLDLDPELAELQWKRDVAGVTEARNALADARRRLEEARSLAPQRSIAETVVRDLEAEVAEDEAALQRAEAQAGYSRGVLERHQLRAPFAGVVNAKLTELGEWVDPGQAVLHLVATDALRLDFKVPEDYLADVGPQTLVRFTLSAMPDQPRDGRVTTVVPVTDPGARTFLLRVQPLEQDDALRPGMSARAELKLATGRQGLVVPRDAILRFPDGRAIVWVVDATGDGPVAAERVVRVGLAFDGVVEVREGLEPGARVVVRGNEALHGGQRLSPRDVGGG